MANEVAVSRGNFPFKRLADLLKRNRKACIVGYEFSWISFAPHFKDVLKGSWSELSASSRINPFTSVKDYCLVMNWFSWRRQAIRVSNSVSKPSDNFRILREMQEKDQQFTIATQCVDGLMNLNGIENAYELYGNVFQAMCYENGHQFPSWATFEMIDKVITCETCGSPIFPNVEMFGWNKKAGVRASLLDQIEQSEVLILIGVDKELAPFNEMNNKRFVKLPIIEFLEDGILLMEEKSAYMASINEIEKYMGDRITTSGDWSLKRTIGYLNQMQ